jgi:hypothetical protein
MTYKEIEIIGHSLGIDVYYAKNSKLKKDKKLPEKYNRNHFQAGPGSHYWDNLLELKLKGYIKQREQFKMPVFHVTDEGIQEFELKFKKYML